MDPNKSSPRVTVTFDAPFFELNTPVSSDISFSILSIRDLLGTAVGGEARMSSSKTTVFFFGGCEPVGRGTACFAGLVALGTVVEVVKVPLSSSLPGEVDLPEKGSELLSPWLLVALRARLEGGRLAAPFALFCVCVCVCVCACVCDVYVCVCVYVCVGVCVCGWVCWKGCGNV